MTYEFITYRVQDRIAYVTINRPEVMNAMHAEATRRCWTPSRPSVTMTTPGSPS